jgi:hypothetical protein
MMKWFLAFGAIALIVFGMLAFHSRNSHAPILSEVSEKFGTLSGISTPSDFSATYGNVTYAGSETGGVGIAMQLVQSTPSLGGGKLVMASVIVHNDRHEAITIGPTNFQILDSEGNLYSAAAGNPFAEDEASISAVEGLNPGLTTVHFVYFEVPSNLSMDNLSLRYHFDSGATFVGVPLRVSSSGGAPAPGDSSQSGSEAATQQNPSQSPQPDSDRAQTSTSGTQPNSSTETQTEQSPQAAPLRPQVPATPDPPSNTPTPQAPN